MSLLLLALACKDPTPSGTGGPDDTARVDSGDTALTDDTATPDDTAPQDDTAETDDTGGFDWSSVDPLVLPDVWVTPYAPAPGDTVTVHYAADFATRDALVVHYGFNGWNLDAEGTTRTDAGSDSSWAAELAMTPVSGGFEVALTIPEDARALHMAFTDPGVGDWDNNDGRDYHWSIRFPYIGPFLAWDDSAQAGDGVVVTWESSIPGLGVVEYGATEDLGSYVAGTVADHLHHVPVTGLEPESTLYYRVRDAAGRTSEIMSYRVPALAPETWTFVAMSDMQDNGEDQCWSEVAATVLANHGDAAFLLVPGDMPADDQPGHWWTFFDMGRSLLSGHPIVAAPGNHDTPGVSSSTDTSSLERYFPRPGDAVHYALTFADTRILMLNSEDDEAFQVGGEQYLFAQAEITSWAGRPVIAAWHKPPYDAGSRHAPEQGETRPVTEFFDGAVSWVVGGHEHFYQRMVPVRFDALAAPSGAYGTGADDGVGYVALPPAGNRPSSRLVDASDAHADARALLAYPVVDEDDTTAASEVGFVVFTVSDDAWELTTYGMGEDGTVDPHVVDSVSAAR